MFATFLYVHVCVPERFLRLDCYYIIWNRFRVCEVSSMWVYGDRLTCDSRYPLVYYMESMKDLSYYATFSGYCTLLINGLFIAHLRLDFIVKLKN